MKLLEWEGERKKKKKIGTALSSGRKEAQSKKREHKGNWAKMKHSHTTIQIWRETHFWKNLSHTSELFNLQEEEEEEKWFNSSWLL